MIMRRTRLKNIAKRTRDPSDWARFKVQRNLVVNMNRNAKSAYFANTDIKTDCKGFWDACKPFFSEKGVGNGKIVLVEGENIITDDKSIATTFNEYYSKITDSLPIELWGTNETFSNSSVSSDPVVIAINKFKDHPSIAMIKSFQFEEGSFEFEHGNFEEVYNTILSFDPSKKTGGDIPLQFLRMAASEIASPLSACFNESLDSRKFPSELKLADTTPLHKKDSATDKSNYRPISLLPSPSKIYERLAFKQLSSFMETRFSKYLCGFRKGYATQHCLLNLLHSWQSLRAQSKKIGAVLLDLSKAFDVMPHDLLIAKLSAYGVGFRSLQFLHSYLTDRKMRVRVGSTYSDWLDVLLGVRQGSILGPLLFNIFINDLFMCPIDSLIANFADDNTISASGETVEDVLDILSKDVKVINDWFKKNEMVINADKFKLLLIGCENSGSRVITINDQVISASPSVKLLGVIIDEKLSFSDHIYELCKKANHKVSALLRIRSLIDTQKATLLSNSYIFSNFRYCPLIWMFCSKGDNNLISRAQTRALRAVNSDFNTPTDALLYRYETDSVHTHNLRSLATEVYKSVNHLNPSFMWDLF